MVLSLIGPLNNIFGPGLTIDVADSGSGTPSFNERYFAYFFTGAALSIGNLTGFGTAFVNSNHQSSMTLQPDTQFATTFREAVSAGGQVGVSLHRVGNDGLDLEPPHVIPAVTWDPALELQVLIHNIVPSSGGFTDSDRALLQSVYAAVTADVHNAP